MRLTNVQRYVYGATSMCPVERHEAEELATFYAREIDHLTEERFAHAFDDLVERGVIDLEHHFAPGRSMHFGNA